MLCLACHLKERPRRTVSTRHVTHLRRNNRQAEIENKFTINPILITVIYGLSFVDLAHPDTLMLPLEYEVY